MGSGMNLEQAKEYAKTMTYTEAVLNTKYAKGIAFKKATRIKLYELAEIADRLDRKTEPQTEQVKCPFNDPIPCEWVNCPNSTDCSWK